LDEGLKALAERRLNESYPYDPRCPLREGSRGGDCQPGSAVTVAVPASVAGRNRARELQYGKTAQSVTLTRHQKGRARRNLRICLRSLRSKSAKPRSCHPSTTPVARAMVTEPSEIRKSPSSSFATLTSFA